MFMIFSDYMVFVLGFLLIMIVAISQSQDNIQDAFSGEKSELFKNQKARGIELFLMRSTFVLAILFLGMIFLTLYLHSR
jgi:preprotein translocase subunit SecG